jgi:SAM-dependent methyltransferase
MLPPLTTQAAVRSTSFGQGHDLSFADRFGIWLSHVQMRRALGGLDGKDVANFGCGFNATFERTIVDRVGSLTLVDVALAEDLKAHPKIRALCGALPEIVDQVPSSSLDVVLCVNVLEHLWEPEKALRGFKRVLRPGGVCFLNVPSWSGKVVLELLAFRLGLAPAAEMDDHKDYYDTRHLWRLAVRAGFKPSRITCRTHKFGLNVFAVCRND